MKPIKPTLTLALLLLLLAFFASSPVTRVQADEGGAPPPPPKEDPAPKGEEAQPEPQEPAPSEPAPDPKEKDREEAKTPEPAKPEAPATPEAPAEVCAKCKGTGQIPCKAHEKLNVGELKVGDFVCADCLDLACCHGVGWVPCPVCKKGQAKWDATVKAHTARCKEILGMVEGQWLHANALRFVKERQSRAKPADKAAHVVPRAFLNVLESDGQEILLATDIAGRRVVLGDGKTLTPMDAHQVHHLYMNRAMEVVKEARLLHRADAFDPKAAQAKDKGEIPKVKAMRAFNYFLCLFANEEAERQITANIFQHESPGSMTAPNIMTAWESPTSYGDDKELHRAVYAGVAGGIIHQYNEDPRRTYEDKKNDERLPSWICEGFRHFLEIRHFGVCEEGGVMELKKNDPKKGVEGWKADNWPKAIIDKMNKGKIRPFPELSKLISDDMGCSDHQVAWAYMDFVLRQGMDKLAVLIPKLRKKGCDEAAILREVYGMNQAELEDKWQEFARKTYAK